MATSQIVLYKTNITPERNCKVDDIGSYLIMCEQEIISDFQYKVIRLDDTIKLDMSQTNTPNFPYNYLAVKRDSETKIYYYFILNSNWKSENTVELQISLDTINTFWNELSWTAKTNITRQHKDRFLQKARDASGTTRFQRIIDDYDEGITPVKFLKSEKKINDIGDDLDWYLIYKTNPQADTTLECYCCASQILKFHSDSAKGIYSEQLKNIGDSVYFSTTDNPDFYYHKGKDDEIHFQQGGPVRAALLIKTADGMDLFHVTVVGIPIQYVKHIAKSTTIFEDYQLSGTYFTPAEVIYPPTHEYYNFSILEQKAAAESNKFNIGDAYIESIDTLDRTDTKLVKIIKMPYAPFELVKASDGNYIVQSGYIISKGRLRLNNLNTEFLNKLNQDTFSELQRTLTNDYIDSLPVHDITMESKLFNSNFYGIRYYYDNFEKEFLLERYSPKLSNTQNIYATIKFKQSNNISSNSLFDFELTNANYNEPTVYSRYMMANRSQEMALYTNDYLNYIRNGYNYDKKIKNAQNTANKIGLAASVVGATASFVSSIWTGGAGVAAGISFATSAIASLTSTIVTIQNNEMTLAQKLEDESRKASSVSTMDDTNLLAYYNGNRLISTREQCTEQMRQAIYNLFRLTGYGCNEYGIPNFNSRIYYNFVQCKAAFDESNWKYGQDFLNDIRSRFEIGVTVYHRLNDSYDWLQEKENFESWMMQ